MLDPNCFLVSQPIPCGPELTSWFCGPKYEKTDTRQTMGNHKRTVGKLTGLEQKQTGISSEVSVNNEAKFWFGQVFLVTRLEHI